MNADYITLAIVFIGICVIPILYSSFTRESTRDSERSEHPQRFEASSLAFIPVYGTFLVAGFACWLGNFAGNPDIGGRLFLSSIGVVMFVIAMLAMGQLRAAYVNVDKDTVDIKYGTYLKTIRRSELKRVYTSNGFIVLDTGSIPRVVIPLIFARWKQLFQLLHRG